MFAACSGLSSATSGGFCGCDANAASAAAKGRCGCDVVRLRSEARNVIMPLQEKEEGEDVEDEEEEQVAPGKFNEVVTLSRTFAAAPRSLPAWPRSLAAAAAAGEGAADSGTLVTLNIYDITKLGAVRSVNSLLYPLGTGAFHAAVQIRDAEWSYGYIELGSGVFDCSPRGCEEHRFRESLAMGATKLSRAEVDELLVDLSSEWPGSDYDLLRHNCCTFSSALCQRLGVGPVPAWVTSLAAAGATLEDGVIRATSAAKSAAIMAAAKAGEFDERYHFSGTLRAEAHLVLKAIKGVDARFHIRDHAAEAAHEISEGAHRLALGAHRLEENSLYAASRAAQQLRDAEAAAEAAAAAEAEAAKKSPRRRCGGPRLLARQFCAASRAAVRGCLCGGSRAKNAQSVGSPVNRAA
eukprot:TRINITY_DN64570_c0_g1_i1.p1 TRINITY_DN64570_c0_g1~~TRINITY_DN64570_c0_g1_i1.p1  ORF type:complete len:409 (+),score=122.64 TRINITY_DN64570_c0_g1_i1:90-1316(+)